MQSLEGEPFPVSLTAGHRVLVPGVEVRILDREHYHASVAQWRSARFVSGRVQDRYLPEAPGAGERMTLVQGIRDQAPAPVHAHVAELVYAQP